MRIVDLTGQRFGRLSVIAMTPERRRGGVCWQVRCDCGTEKLLDAGYLRDSGVKSCGCYAKEVTARRLKGRAADRSLTLEGRRFGKLLVISRAPLDGQKSQWNVKCACGTAFVACAGNLKKMKSCAKCWRIDKFDLTGQKFGHLTVIDRAVSFGLGWRFNLRCICGATVSRSGSSLRSGETTHCGCMRGKVPWKGKPTTVKGVLMHRMNTAVRQSIRKRGGSFRGQWQEVLGYDVDKMEAHLSRTMPSGYSWDDFIGARLHIDHKTPLSAFNFTSQDHVDFRAAWRLTNLQLLPALINMRKSGKLDRPFQPSLLIAD